MEWMEGIAPVRLAESWDNVGLTVGDENQPVHRIRVALNPTPAVVQTAATDQVNLLITHHPLFIVPLSTIRFSTTEGTVIQAAALHRISLVAAHTNLDSAAGGVNDVLARRIGLQNIRPLGEISKTNPNVGLGRTGELSSPAPLSTVVETVKTALSLPFVRYAGDAGAFIRTAAVLGGSGGSMVDRFLESDADVFISGDLKYHDALRITGAGRAMIDAGHFGSEFPIVAALADRLSEIIRTAGFSITVDTDEAESDVFSGY
jgi:dinuclear metal center YbgI/SA1388 family protein